MELGIMVTLHFPVDFKKSMKKKNYPEKVGLGKYDGDAWVEGELSGCKFTGTLLSYDTTRRWYFDVIGYFVECEKINDAIETARVIEKTLIDKGLKFSIPHYELNVDNLVTLPFNVMIRYGSCQYELAYQVTTVECEKLEDFNVIKK